MGRTGKKELTETIEQKIGKAQIKVVKTKTAYEAAVSSLQTLLDKRDARRKDELWKAVLSSIF